MGVREEAMNAVFGEWRNIYFSKEEKAAIAAAHGEDVLAAVLAVYDALMEMGAGPWGMDEGLRRFGELARREYPWLSAAARSKLAHAFLMNWK